MSYTILVTEPSLAPAGTEVLKRADCEVLYLPRSNAASEQVRVLGSEPVDAILARGLPVTAEAVQASSLPSFSDRTEHFAEDRLCRQHLGELFGQGP